MTKNVIENFFEKTKDSKYVCDSGNEDSDLKNTLFQIFDELEHDIETNEEILEIATCYKTVQKFCLYSKFKNK